MPRPLQHSFSSAINFKWSIFYSGFDSHEFITTDYASRSFHFALSALRFNFFLVSIFRSCFLSPSLSLVTFSHFFNLILSNSLVFWCSHSFGYFVSLLSLPLFSRFCSFLLPAFSICFSSLYFPFILSSFPSFLSLISLLFFHLLHSTPNASQFQVAQFQVSVLIYSHCYK